MVVREDHGSEVLAHLMLNIPNYYGDMTQRELAVELSDYLAQRLEGLRPDFVVRDRTGKTVVVEAKAWSPTREATARAERYAKYYRAITGRDSVIVMPSLRKTRAATAAMTVGIAAIAIGEGVTATTAEDVVIEVTVEAATPVCRGASLLRPPSMA